jgi:hypothetical protein
MSGRASEHPDKIDEDAHVIRQTGPVPKAALWRIRSMTRVAQRMTHKLERVTADYRQRAFADATMNQGRRFCDRLAKMHVLIFGDAEAPIRQRRFIEPAFFRGFDPSDHVVVGHGLNSHNPYLSWL